MDGDMQEAYVVIIHHYHIIVYAESHVAAMTAAASPYPSHTNLKIDALKLCQVQFTCQRQRLHQPQSKLQVYLHPSPKFLPTKTEMADKKNEL